MFSLLNRYVMPWIGVAVLAYFAVLAVIPRPRGQLVLYAPGVPDVPVALTRSALSDFATAGPGPANSFRVPVDTPVEVISRSPLSAEVRVADGRHGWVFAEWLATK